MIHAFNVTNLFNTTIGRRFSLSAHSWLSAPPRNQRPGQLPLASLAAATMLVAGAVNATTQTAPILSPTILWTTIDREDVTMSSVSRIAVDAKQRAYVVESKENAIYVYDATGAYLNRFGRKGAGPGEFGNPCCAAFDAKGRLWVLDLDHSRYVVFALAENGKAVKATPVFVVAAPASNSNFGVPINVDRSGNVTSLATVREGNDPQTLVKRFLVDSTSKIVRTLVELPQIDNVTPAFKHRLPNSPNGVTVFLYQPYGADALRADGPDGVYALVGAAKYVVRWFSSTGALLRTLTRDVRGPLLSAREHTRGDSLLGRAATRGQTSVGVLPFAVPERKPPVLALFFDADGRLWVERSVADGAAHEADVYAINGNLAFRATWPATVELASAGFIRGNSAWGISLDSDDVPHVVRLEFAPSK